MSAAAVGAALLVGAAAPATAAPGGSTAPTRPDGRCVVDAAKPATTVDSLMNHCTGPQILKLFAEAERGAAPTGTKSIALLPVFQFDGELLPYEPARALTRTQNKLGSSLTFARRGDADWVYKEYVWGRDAGGPLTEDASWFDGRPVFTADFSRDFAGLPLSRHEYRQLTPGVWIGRDTMGAEPAERPGGGAVALY